jgi:hypothetical protein
MWPFGKKASATPIDTVRVIPKQYALEAQARLQEKRAAIRDELTVLTHDQKLLAGEIATDHFWAELEKYLRT